MNINAIIIDDELDAINTLDFILKKYCKQVTVVAKTNIFNEGIQHIVDKKPDLVFLDIEMPQGSGFDLLEKLPDNNFEVVFVTAHDHYALKAIKHNALDYIIKPVNIQELIDAVQKVIQKRTKVQEGNNVNIERLLDWIKTDKCRKISISTSKGVEFVNVDEIVFIEADGSYSNLYMEDKNKIMVSKNIMDFEIILPRDQFYRCHKSYIVNMSHIKRILPVEGYIEMNNGTKVLLSRRKKEEFMDEMSKRMLNG